MGFVRVISQKHFDPKKKRFQSLAFKPSSTDGGISVFDQDCAIQVSGNLCTHIQKFYSQVAGDPPIFWKIPESILPADISITQSVSSSGDQCHFNIGQITEKDARKIIMGVSIHDFMICINGSHRELEEEDLIV